jgi:hypothetical protein
LTLKRELGLHLIWSSKPVVVLAQVWACLIIAQVLQAIRMQVALRADVDAFEVSLPLLLEALPQLGGQDGVVCACVRQGRQLGIIRPSTRLVIEAPMIPLEQLIPLPKDTVLSRLPHYSRKKPARKRTDPKITVHPQRDLLVAILTQREATLAKSKPTTTLPTRPTRQSVATLVTSDVQPDCRIPRPSWAFLKPLFAEASLNQMC